MGERDPGLGPAPPPPPWKQRAVLAAGLAALLASVLALGPAEASAGFETPALVTRLLEAPLASLAGSRGPAVLGVLMLAVAAATGCWSLEKRVGESAPLLVALFIFGSGCWALAWTSGAALVPLALAVTAFALAYAGGGAYEAPTEIYRPQEAGSVGVLRWLVVGLLLAELLPAGGPLLAGLMLPAALAVPYERRSSFLPALLIGFAAGLAVELAIQGPRFVVGPIGLAAESFRIDYELAGRSLLGLLVGRNVGLLIGFTPCVLILALGLGTVARPMLITVGLALPVLGALLLPFDFAAGWLNLAFVPVYGALWQLPVRGPRRREWIPIVLLCGLAYWPAWVAPRPALADGGVRLTAAVPRRYLPYEATLRNLPNLGEARLGGEDLRIRAVSGCRFLGDSSRFELDGAGPAEIWFAAPSEIEMVALEFGPGAPSSLEVEGATAGRSVYRPDGRVGFEVLLDASLGPHRLWFDDRPSRVQTVRIRLPGWQGPRPLRFRLLAKPQP